MRKPKLGRFVRKGEKGVLILAPILRENQTHRTKTTTQSAFAVFRAAYIFDIA
jgi:hypothetical protein